MLDGFGWRAPCGGDDVACLVEVRAEEGRFPALDRFLEWFCQRERAFEWGKLVLTSASFV